MHSDIYYWRSYDCSQEMIIMLIIIMLIKFNQVHLAVWSASADLLSLWESDEITHEIKILLGLPIFSLRYQTWHSIYLRIYKEKMHYLWILNFPHYDVNWVDWYVCKKPKI